METFKAIARTGAMGLFEQPLTTTKAKTKNMREIDLDVIKEFLISVKKLIKSVTRRPGIGGGLIIGIVRQRFVHSEPETGSRNGHMPGIDDLHPSMARHGSQLHAIDVVGFQSRDRCPLGVFRLG